MNKQLKLYEEAANWDFSNINYEEEFENSWDMYDEVKKYADEKSLILDLGTGGGEKVLSKMPKDVGMIIGTDLSPNMIKTAKENLAKTRDIKAKFLVMDNLKIEFPDGLFDIVTARHTVINAKEIYRVLNDTGLLIVRGVNQHDCWDMKELFNRGQAYKDKTAISEKDYIDIKNAGFKKIEKIAIEGNEYYKTPEDLLNLLSKAPILDDFSEEDNTQGEERKPIEKDIFQEYVRRNMTEKGIRLKRVYYGIIAKK